VERSLNDPTIVVTTYEGKHTHPNPVMARSSAVHAGSLLPQPECTTNFASNQNYNMSQYYNQQRQQALLIVYHLWVSLQRILLKRDHHFVIIIQG
jgi:hypothetical protein